MTVIEQENKQVEEEMKFKPEGAEDLAGAGLEGERATTAARSSSRTT